MKKKYKKILNIVRPGSTAILSFKEGVGNVKRIDVINSSVRIYEVGVEVPYEFHNCQFTIEYEEVKPRTDGPN